MNAIPASMADYRAGYPGRSFDDTSLNDNLKFYRGEIRCRPDGLFIDELHARWRGAYNTLEERHGFIQWLFPIREAGVNSSSQVLQNHEIAAMRQDPAVVKRLLTSFDVMLDFYGFQVKESSSVVEVSKTDDWAARFTNLVQNPHNNLRITRMLKCMGEMGLEDHKLAWLRALEVEVLHNRTLAPCADAYRRFWIQSIYDEATRSEFESRAK